MPEQALTLSTSPALAMKAQWIGWQAVISWRFWPRMAERCADQNYQEHGVSPVVFPMHPVAQVHQ